MSAVHKQEEKIVPEGIIPVEMSEEVSYTRDSIVDARTLFVTFQEEGIILNDSFSDRKWSFSDEYSHVRASFEFPQLSYRRFYETLFGIPFHEFVDYVKVYTLFHMGQLVLRNLSGCHHSKVVSYL